LASRGGIREVIYPDYLTRDFTFFGKEYLIFDGKKIYYRKIT
jgi:HD superfamily phosphohydrolase